MLPAMALQPIPKADALDNGQLAISKLLSVTQILLPIALECPVRDEISVAVNIIPINRVSPII